MLQPENESKNVIEAEEFILKSADGKVRARLGMDKYGCPGFRLYDSNGIDRCVISIAPDGAPIIGLGDESDNPCLVLGQSDDGTGLKILDKHGKVRAQIFINGSGERLDL